MTVYRSAAAAAVALSLLTVASAVACPVYIEPKLTDARLADAVVVGQVTKHVREISLARKASIDTWLADNPDASREARRDVRSATDLARLTVEVDQTIAGAAPSTVTVFWHRAMNNGPPASISGDYVFALRELPSTSTDSDGAYAVLQGICSGALVFRRGSVEGNAIREMFGLGPEPLQEPSKTPGDWWKEPAIPWPTLVAFGLLGAGAALAAVLVIWPRRPPQKRS